MAATVNGNVAIQSGSALQIAPSTPVKVGTMLDLIGATVENIAGVGRMERGSTSGGKPVNP